MTGEGATSLGYRRISNRHCIVARIDRPDWLEHMAEQMHRSPAFFLIRGGRAVGKVEAGWFDHYRRCYSRDRITLTQNEYKKVPASGWDTTGFIIKIEGRP
jgi:phage terminase small subunit